MAVGHTLYRDRIQWDADRDFAHIAIILGTPYLLLVNPQTVMRTVADFVAAAKRPNGVAYATSGIGSVPHLVGLRLAQAAGFELQHMPSTWNNGWAPRGRLSPSLCGRRERRRLASSTSL